MKKILVIGFTDNVGGMETFYMTYYRKINHDNFKIDFVTSYKKIAFESELEERGSVVYKLPDFKKRPVSYSKGLKKILLNAKYDIVHINMLSAANILPMKVAEKCGIKKIIVHCHNNGIPKNFIKRLLDAFNKNLYLRRKNFTFLACSKEAGEWMFGLKKEFQVFNNAIDLDTFKFDVKSRQKIRNQYNINDDEFLLGHVGRFSEQKNQVFLIKIMKRIVEKNSQIKLMLIGKGADIPFIKSKIEEFNLDKHVIIVDNQNDVHEFYSAFDLFVFPSVFEGLGIVALEAQASGLQCIFSENILKIVDLNDGNIYINLDNEKEWTESILQFEEKKCERIVNYENFREKGFDINYEQKKLEDIYNLGGDFDGK